MKTFSAIAGQSIFDVCLNTYGTLDYLFKLMQDNGFTSVNTSVFSGQQFVFDDNLIYNQATNSFYTGSGVRYSTDISGYGSVFYISNNTGQPVTPPNTGSGGVTPPPFQTYQMVYNTSYTSNADGVAQLTPTDINGNSLAGFDIVQIEKEIKPLKASEFIWNKALGQLNLVGNSLNTGETLFILYSKIITA